MKQNFIMQYENYCQLRGLAKRTIAIYSSIVSRYLSHVNNKPDKATTEQIICFALKSNSSRSREQVIGALQHFYKGVLHQPKRLKFIPKVKRQEFIPNILTIQEAQSLINNTKNLKHKAILALIYYGALRISEAVNFKIEHLNKNGVAKIVQSKGAKDRMIPITPECVDILRQYYKKYKPQEYLFNGQNRPSYSPKSIQKILQQQLAKNNIVKHIRVHDLRHSRATHLLDAGVDIKFLKDFLGHRKIETTERYLHTSTKSLQLVIEKADSTMKIAA